MLRNLFSSRTSDLSLEEALELTNKRLELARKEGDAAKALELCRNAKSLMKDAENIFTSTNSKDLTLSEGIANAYHEHGRLLDDLEYHDKAEESHIKAEKWGYVHVVSRHTDSLQSLGDGTIRPPIPPTAALSVAPSVVAVLYQDTKTDVAQLNHQDHTLHATPAKVINGKPTPNKDVVQIPQIFDQNITPPVTKYALPEAGERITSTPQLAYCLSLLHPSTVSKEEVDQSECDWLQARVDDPDEQERLQTMATDLIRAFVREELKKPGVVAEVVSLAAVLEQDDFRKLLQAFVDGVNQSVLLNVHLLDGLAQLIRNASQGYIEADDLVKIMELLNARLKDTHEQSTRHTHQLALTISQVLDSMVDSQVKGLSHEQLHKPLSDYLKGLQESSDPYLIYQAAYAYQALLYIPDDETILQSMMRRTGKVVQGISGVVSTVKALDLIGFIEGLQIVQQGLAGAEKAIGLVSDACSNGVALVKNGQGLLASLKEGFRFNHKGSWYPALRGLERLVQEGRFADFERLIREAPCQHDPAFRWGVCQRLGEIAANTIWGLNTRKCAVELLGQLYKDNANYDQQVNIKQWILCILNQLAESSKDIIEGSAQELLQKSQANSSSDKGIIYRGCENDIPVRHPTMVTPPPMEFPLLDCVQNKPDVETPLRQLRRERLKDRGGDVYISPRAKASLRVTEDFDLTSKVQEFIDSNRKVLLLLGDSGAGKSTFNRVLEISLWDKYDKVVGRIPLFIYLPAIDKPEYDLIGKHLRKLNFTENQIRELKMHREFVVICDGYDESQQTRNLYQSNQLNQPGGWHAQMVVGCRTEYTGVDYKDSFRPIDLNNRGIQEQFQEAVIVPFNKDQIQNYIEQYVFLRKPQWKTENYEQAIKQVPNLQDLVKNPFLLKLALEVLPELLGTTSKFSEAHITRVVLYDEFVAQWIARGRIRLGEMELSPHDKSAFEDLLESGFKQHAIAYLKLIVTAMYDNQKGNPTVSYSEFRDRRTWKESLFNNEDGKNLLQHVIPLNHEGDQFRFIHRSVLDYGLSLTIFDPSEHNEDMEPTSVISRRGSTSSALSFETPDLGGTAAITVEQYLLDSPLGRGNFVKELSIVQFLSERVQQHQLFKAHLHSVTERSKVEESTRIAAANAITILVRAGVQFNGADLRGVRIPGADLSYGVFDSAQLEGADLRKANLRNTWMRQANLRGAQMKGVQFGELPFLKEDGGVRCCAYSPDGRRYAAALDNGNISLYETSGWDRIQTLKGHSRSVNSLSFSATNNQIASGGHDKTVRLWDVDTGVCFHTLQGHSDRVYCVAYSPKGDRIASGSDDKTVRLWNIDTGECVHTLQGHSNYVLCIAYSPKGNRIASGGGDSTVQLWNVDTGECVRTLQGHSGAVYSVMYSPKGDRIASGSSDKTVRLWDVDTGECIRTLQGHSDYVLSAVYSPKGDRIASGSGDKTVRLWDVDTGECVHALEGHSGNVNSVVYSPKGDQIVSGSTDKTARLWDIDTGEYIHTLESHSDYVRIVAYSPKGDQVASGSDDFTVRLWDIDTGECTHTLWGHSKSVKSVAYSPKGDRIVSGSLDSTMRLWDVDTGECVHTLQGYSVDSVVYSPKRNRIASGSYDRTVRLWDVDTGECVHILQGHSSDVNIVVYSPKGDRIASGSSDSTVRLWDVDTGECIRTLQGHGMGVFSVVYSPKGDQIATGSTDETLRLWDIDTGECVHILKDHSSYVFSVAYSPKGDQIASGSDDMTVKLWNVETGQCLATISGFSNRVSSIAFESNFGAQYLVTGSFDKSVRRWRITKEGVEHNAALCWSSSHEVLTVCDLSFEDVQGLSRLDQKLLIQRGALIPKSPLSKQ